VTFHRGTNSDTRFGLQPVREVMKRERYTCKELAERVSVPYGHMYQVITGRISPSPRLREVLPAILRTPMSELFTAEALAHEFGVTGVVRHGIKPRSADVS
jgi:hypothetical protein